MKITASVKSFKAMFLAAVLFGAVGALLPTHLFAQAADNNQRLMVTVVTVKPDMVDEYEAFVKAETIPALQKGGVVWRDGWKTAMFGAGSEYTYVQPIASFADFDGPSPIEKALGKDGAEAWSNKAARFSTSVKRYVIQVRPDLSYTPNMGDAPVVAVLNRVTVTPGRASELEAWVKNDLLPVMRLAKVPGFRVSKVGLGGNPNEYISLTIHANMAELEKGPPVYRVMSRADGDKLYAKLPAGVVQKTEQSVIRYVPALSFHPAAAAAK